MYQKRNLFIITYTMLLVLFCIPLRALANTQTPVNSTQEKSVYSVLNNNNKTPQEVNTILLNTLLHTNGSPSQDQTSTSTFYLVENTQNQDVIAIQPLFQFLNTIVATLVAKQNEEKKITQAKVQEQKEEPLPQKPKKTIPPAKDTLFLATPTITPLTFKKIDQKNNTILLPVAEFQKLSQYQKALQDTIAERGLQGAYEELVTDYNVTIEARNTIKDYTATPQIKDTVQLNLYYFMDYILFLNKVEKLLYIEDSPLSVAALNLHYEGNIERTKKTMLVGNSLIATRHTDIDPSNSSAEKLYFIDSVVGNPANAKVTAKDERFIYEYTLKDGFIDGVYTIKEPTGKTIAELHYKQGVLNGKYTNFKKEYEVGYVNGKMLYYKLFNKGALKKWCKLNPAFTECLLYNNAGEVETIEQITIADQYFEEVFQNSDNFF